ncbi:MAG TPA: peptidylprolyl isomerase [Candidatus Saccharimonadales bacterium]|nr:peptidylprolyl isomerase [Candidatus Saccharimonadales bacterium]
MKQLKTKLKSAGGKMRHKLPGQSEATPPPGRITNDTVAQHREQILSAGRRFKYPLQHSKQRIIVMSAGIVMAALLLFSTLCWWQLYKQQSTGTFMYRVAAIVPVPVAKIDGAAVRYGDYLNTLRSSMHYLATQEGVSFKTEDGKRQLQDLKQRALSQELQYALIKKIAKQRKITVSDQEVETQVQRIINQQAYAGSLKLYKDVIKKEYDQSYSQWRETLRLQLLRNKVYAAIDTSARARADKALADLNNGADFAATAKAMSDDTARREAGGEIGILEKGKADLPPELQDALFSLKAGQHSDVISSKQGLFIMRAIEVDGSKVRAAAIFFKYQAFSDQLQQLQKDNKVKSYITVPVQLTLQ